MEMIFGDGKGSLPHKYGHPVFPPRKADCTVYSTLALVHLFVFLAYFYKTLCSFMHLWKNKHDFVSRHVVIENLENDGLMNVQLQLTLHKF